MALLIALSLAMTGCQSRSAGTQFGDCVFSPGMSTDQLSSCGCFPADTRNDGSMMLMSEDARNNTRTITIVNYMCPLGSAGIARVVVANGVSTGVYH
jgi:hypothetical protein